MDALHILVMTLLEEGMGTTGRSSAIMQLIYYESFTIM